MIPGKIGRIHFCELRLRTLFLCFFLFSSLSVFSFHAGHCAQVTLAWDQVNNPQLAGYTIYYGNAPGSYQWLVDVGNVTTHTLTNLTIGATYYAAATAFTANDMESNYSNEVMFTIPSCTYAISPLSASFASSGGSGSIGITTPSYCNWTTSSGVSWITVNTGSGLGSGTMTYSVASNTGTTSRTASLTIAGNVFTITQSGAVVNYTISASSGTGGTISPSGQVSVQSGAGQTFTFSSNTGYKITDVLVDGVSKGAVGSYTFSNVQANHTISASFSAVTYTLSLSNSGSGSGAVSTSPSGTTFPAGTVVTLTATPDASSTFAGWSGGCSGSSTYSQVTMNSNLSVTATFNDATTTLTHTISATAGSNGTISPSGKVTVNDGASMTFNITPKFRHRIVNVNVDGVWKGPITSYTFTKVYADHQIKAYFR
jgi:hypothetical protein